MTIKHHVSSELLTAYAAGQLPEAFSLVVACHLSLCAKARKRVDELESVGGAVLENAPVALLSEGALLTTLDKIAAMPRRAAPCEHKYAANNLFPTPLHNYIDPENVKWSSIGGGVKQSILSCKGVATARLLYIPAGLAVPDHSHNGLEMTIVLSGSFSDAEVCFERGDVETADDDLRHQPIAGKSEPCICLAATEGRLRFSALMPRFIQPFIRI